MVRAGANGGCLVSLLFWSLLVCAQTDLVHHPSPYLQSHVDDPIRWRSPESVRSHRGQQGNMLYLVSSGYLSCYWCYRFKHDTLHDPALAELINHAFIPVLLDREMHAEDDRLLQAFVKDFLGTGGWPATAVVTPAGEPVMAWTYVTAPTLRSALKKLSEAWSEDPTVTHRLLASRLSAPVLSTPDDPYKPTLERLLQGFLDQAGTSSDIQFGGFGSDAKYPFVPQLLALVNFHQLNASETIAAFLRHSLDAMIDGDLIDPVEGGVFRYTENRDWSEPHFEQMLYTQALMGRLYFIAATVLNQPEYSAVADRILDNMLARFAGMDGWFVASLSATGEQGLNGSYYLVAERDLVALLGDTWRANVEISQQVGNQLLVTPTGPLTEVTRQALQLLRRGKTLERDEKQLLSWNGLALSALSHGAVRRPEYLSAATDLATAMMDETRDSSLGLLVGVDAVDVPADLDTLVYAAAGLFDWWQVSGDARVADRVTQLLERAVVQFYRESGWHRAPSYVLAGSGADQFIPDDQIPSPTAEWFRLMVGCTMAGMTLGPKTREIADEMVKIESSTLLQSAFFHPTQISALVLGRFLGIH